MLRRSSRLIVDGAGPSRRAISRIVEPRARKVGDPLPLQQRQVAVTTIGLGQPRWRHTTPFGPPALPGLAGDAYQTTRLHRALAMTGPGHRQDVLPHTRRVHPANRQALERLLVKDCCMADDADAASPTTVTESLS